MKTFVLGGARSGKSAYAEKLATASGLPVTYIATAQVYDTEFEQRIAHHKTRRPAEWGVVEEPFFLYRHLAPTRSARLLLAGGLPHPVARAVDLPGLQPAARKKLGKRAPNPVGYIAHPAGPDHPG